jgi:hypothetical protein
VLYVPRRKQDSDVTCLPTCVWAVLTFEGFDVAYEDILEACRMDERGAVLELAIQGLAEAGWDVEFTRTLDLQSISEHLSEERPLIAVLEEGGLRQSRLAHSVVICDFMEAELVAMDPAVGEYVNVPLQDARDIHLEYRGGFFIGQGRGQL